MNNPVIFRKISPVPPIFVSKMEILHSPDVTEQFKDTSEAGPVYCALLLPRAG
jgi:hypothetical protein